MATATFKEMMKEKKSVDLVLQTLQEEEKIIMVDTRSLFTHADIINFKLEELQHLLNEKEEKVLRLYLSKSEEEGDDHENRREEGFSLQMVVTNCLTNQIKIKNNSSLFL